MAKIINIGSLNLDEVFAVPHFIKPAETMACLSYRRFIGGKGTNQSIALARAGARVFHAGKVGEDGAAAISTLAEAGVDVSLVLRSSGTTGRALIQVDPSGQNCIILYAGANRDIGEPDVDRFLSSFGPGDAALFQNETSSLGYAMEAAGRKSLRIFFNPSPADEGLGVLPFDLVDCLILNEVEGAALAGMGEPGIDAAAAAQDMLAGLRRAYPRPDLVLTLGAAGVRYLGSDGERIAVPALPVDPVDTTAAGDTFTGYYVAARLRGEPAGLALRDATAAAAVCVTRIGASPSIPRREELPLRD